MIGGPPGIGMNPRMNPPRVPSIGAPLPAGYAPGIRGPPPPGTAQRIKNEHIYVAARPIDELAQSCFSNAGGPVMPPGMAMASGGRPQWPQNTSTPMNYSSSSPGNYGVSTNYNPL